MGPTAADATSRRRAAGYLQYRRRSRPAAAPVRPTTAGDTTGGKVCMSVLEQMLQCVHVSGLLMMHACVLGKID